MTGERVLGTLRQMCRDLDAGRPLRRIDWRRGLVALAVPVAMGLGSVGVAGCNEATPEAPGSPRVGIVAPKQPEGVGPVEAMPTPSPPPDRVVPRPPEAVSMYAAPPPERFMPEPPEAVAMYSAPEPFEGRDRMPIPMPRPR